MTPIAYRLVRQRMEATEAVNNETDLGQFPTDLTEMRCFDCVAVSDLADDLCDSMSGHSRVPDKVAFLPAPITWIEYALDSQKRAAIWLIDQGDGWAECGFASLAKGDGKVYTLPNGHIQLSDNVDKIAISARAAVDAFQRHPRGAPRVVPSDLNTRQHMFLVYAFLAIINTPRIVGRRIHHAHKGLEREMNRNVPAKDRKKLPEWTEIVLEVDKPARDGDASERGEVLTGKRALHFCRSFIRIRLGKLELVRSHWRGDEELGVRQASYRVKSFGNAAA